MVMNWNTFGRGMAVSAIALSVAGIASAQVTTSSMRGQVTDAEGTAVPNATVVITHTPSGTMSAAVTSANGDFSARGLRVGGPYTVEVSGGDFTPVTVTDIYIDLDQTYPLNLTVSGERKLETVVVTANQLQTGFSSEGLTTTLGLAALNEVVSIDRDITDAAELDPFASVNVQSGGAKELSIAGANSRFNTLTIDGVALNDRFGLNANGYPTQRSPISFDAIQSLSVESAPFDTEYNGFTGGTINAVTKSGTNEFHGSAFYFKTDDSMAGNRSADDTVSRSFEEKTYGGTFGGPIIKDKLFFFLSYDKYEEAAALQRGPTGSGAVNIEDVTPSDISEIQDIMQSVYGFDVGDFGAGVPPVEDEKILGSIDWNITNDHRAKFTYIKTEGATIIEQNGNNFLQGADLAFPSSWYNNSEKVESFIGHLYSDWTPNFSTELKIAKTTQATGADSLNGAEFFLGSVVTSTGTIIAFGPDRFRHGNELDQEFLQYKLKAEYRMGDHTFKAGIEREEVDVDNLFAQNSEGTYAFASIDDLRNQIATRVSYANAITNDENDLRAIWGYNYNSAYVQDSWDIRDDLNLMFGVRYDYYQSEGSIRPNQNFFDRYGYYNTNDIDGLDVILPRFAFKWNANDDITVRGGLGRFSGGSPGVWISNSYSNDGVINGEVFGDGPISVPSTPDATSGNYIPQDLLDQLANTSPDGSVNAIDDTFEIPSTWKANLGVAVNMPGDWLVTADVLYNKLENAPYWYDATCGDAVSASPDGRPVYACTNGRSPNPPQAIIVGSVDKGNSLLWAVSASNDWETPIGDFDLFGSYTHADVNDIGMGTSSTATSNYSDTARYSYQNPRTGTSNFEVEHQFKLRLNWQKEFFRGYATQASLFATRRSGQPYTYTFNTTGSADVFGINESSADDAGATFYVPTGFDDPLFSPDSFGGNIDQQQAFFTYIATSELNDYKGKIAPRNGNNSRWSTLVDLRLQQDLPGAMKNHRTKLFLDIENLGNLLDSNAGRVERVRYEYKQQVANAVIVNNQYVYNNLDTSLNLETLNQSFWQVQIGVKYEF
tara:strand:+ start:184280 stop:187450 length:3171 start_codon:yes stop_codon:yes gene_type:complete